MKVKCVDNLYVEELFTLGEIYEAEKHFNPECIYVRDNFGDKHSLNMNSFEIIEEDNRMKIVCIDNSCVEGLLTRGKEYEVDITLNEWNLMGETGLIKILDDDRDYTHYAKTRFVLKQTWEESKEIVKVVQDNKVNHPIHYNHGEFEVIDVIEDWNLNFNLGNAIKYIGRAGHKDNIIQDLEKAKWYIEREIKRLKHNECPF